MIPRSHLLLVAVSCAVIGLFLLSAATCGGVR